MPVGPSFRPLMRPLSYLIDPLSVASVHRYVLGVVVDSALPVADSPLSVVYLLPGAPTA